MPYSSVHASLLITLAPLQINPHYPLMHSRDGIYCCELLACLITVRHPGDAWSVPLVPHIAGVLRSHTQRAHFTPELPKRANAFCSSRSAPEQVRAPTAPPNAHCRGIFPRSWYLRLIRVQMEGWPNLTFSVETMSYCSGGIGHWFFMFYLHKSTCATLLSAEWFPVTVSRQYPAP